MPTPNGDVWRHSRAKKQLTSDEAGQALDITGGALRQIEQGRKPASLMLAYRAAELYEVKVSELLVDEGDEHPAPQDPAPKPKPAPEPKVEPTGPPPRRSDKGNRPGPPRAAADVVVGVA
jgi:DNA-binding XRE family transcriptional regulator